MSPEAVEVGDSSETRPAVCRRGRRQYDGGGEDAHRANKIISIAEIFLENLHYISGGIVRPSAPN